MTKKTEAKRNGSMLTVGFHAATPPLIWRFDLERNHSFTLSLQGEEGDWELGATTLKGDFYPVAHFDAREEAEEALAQVEKALAQKNDKGIFALKLLSVLGVFSIIVLVILFVVVPVFGIVLNHKFPHMKGAAIQAPTTVEKGVPQSADDILKPPQ